MDNSLRSHTWYQKRAGGLQFSTHPTIRKQVRPLPCGGPRVPLTRASMSGPHLFTTEQCFSIHLTAAPPPTAVSSLLFKIHPRISRACICAIRVNACEVSERTHACLRARECGGSSSGVGICIARYMKAMMSTLNHADTEPPCRAPIANDT